MNDFQLGNVRRQMLRALRQLGASACSVTREERDPNGMTTGVSSEVCRVYGLTYQQQSKTANLLIDMPGVTVSDPSALRFTGVMLQGGTPQAGDLLTTPEGSRRIIRYDERLGVISMALSDELGGGRL